jgi:hypothetical protein
MRWAQLVRVGVLLGMLSAAYLGGMPRAVAQPPTLPPTWTPTFTPTASATYTPSATPTATPTYTATDYCNALYVADMASDRRYYDPEQEFVVVFGTELRDTFFRILIEHRLSQSGVEIPNVEQVTFTSLNVPMTALPRHGLYDWTIMLMQADTESVLCEKGGYFIAGVARVQTATPTEGPAVIVVTATPQTIVVTAPPQVVVVTATPDK